jgi:hypothetical protein
MQNKAAAKTAAATATMNARQIAGLAATICGLALTAAWISLLGYGLSKLIAIVT